MDKRTNPKYFCQVRLRMARTSISGLLSGGNGISPCLKPRVPIIRIIQIILVRWNVEYDESSPERTCDIPKDKAILIPIISGQADLGDPEQTDTSDKGMIQAVKTGNNYAAISVKLDNTTLNFNEDPKFRALSAFYNMTLPEHNLWEEKEKPGTYKAVTDGYFLFLKPLSEGNHTLYYEAATNPPNPNVYAQTVKYHLNVK